MRLATVSLLFVVACSDPLPEPAVIGDQPLIQDPGSGFRGPGEWRPAESTVAAPVDLSLIRSGYRRGEQMLANGTGDHLLFSLAGSACGVDIEEDDMDTDTPVDGTVVVTDGLPESGILFRSKDGVGEARPGAAEPVSLLPGAFRDARYLDGDVVGLTEDCAVVFLSGPRWSLPEGFCDQGSDLASTADALVIAGSAGVVEARAVGVITVDSAPVDLVAAATGMRFTAYDRRIDGPGWSVAFAADTEILDLDLASDLGLVTVDLEVAGDRQLSVLDAATGEALGTLDLRDGTSAVDVSARGGLLLQQRINDVVSWRFTR